MTHDSNFTIGGEPQSLEDLQIRVGTLLKTDSVSFLLGAGASVECGGILVSSVALPLERALLKEGLVGDRRPRIHRWLRRFYLAVRLAGASGAPTDRAGVIARNDAVNEDSAEALPVNFESVLALLYAWRSALPPTGGRRLRIDGEPPLDIQSTDIDDCLAQATKALARLCSLPAEGKPPGSLLAHKDFLRKILTRPLNLKRVNLFTLNYDTLLEQAADAEGVILLDGFVGTLRRVFRPECYDQDLYFPAQTTEGRVHRLDRVLHLYKLHGSITWISEEADWENPYGVLSGQRNPASSGRLLIYPTPAKWGETLGMPYAELFRRCAGAVVRPQSVLFVIGYGFGDEHVRAIIHQALAIPSFTLVIVDPNPTSEFVKVLQDRGDRRVWLLSGPELGRFSAFVKTVLPDLRDEDIQQRVIATHRALQRSAEAGETENPADG